MNCKSCHKELPLNSVQQGGMHISCAEEVLKVFKVWPEAHGSPLIYTEKELINVTDLIKDCGTGERWNIEIVEMSRIEFENLPEHVGW